MDELLTKYSMRSFKQWFEDAGITHDDYVNKGGIAAKGVRSKYRTQDDAPDSKAIAQDAKEMNKKVSKFGKIDPKLFENQNYKHYYQIVDRELNSRATRALWRAGTIPSQDDWEYGAGGTFFAFSLENSQQYGLPKVYYFKRKPSYLIEIAEGDDEFLIDLDGNPVEHLNQYAPYLNSNNCEAIIHVNTQNPSIKNSIIWILNDKISSILQLE